MSKVGFYYQPVTNYIQTSKKICSKTQNGTLVILTFQKHQKIIILKNAGFGDRIIGFRYFAVFDILMILKILRHFDRNGQLLLKITWPKIGLFFVKNLLTNLNKSKVWSFFSRIQIKNIKFCQKFKFLSKHESLVKIQILIKQSKFKSKIEILQHEILIKNSNCNKI